MATITGMAAVTAAEAVRRTPAAVVDTDPDTTDTNGISLAVKPGNTERKGSSNGTD